MFKRNLDFVIECTYSSKLIKNNKKNLFAPLAESNWSPFHLFVFHAKQCIRFL